MPLKIQRKNNEMMVTTQLYINYHVTSKLIYQIQILS